MRKNIIPGIYNYCDRWCERCSLTHRCAIFNDPIGLTNQRKEFEFPFIWGRIPNRYSETILNTRKCDQDVNSTAESMSRPLEEKPDVENARRQHQLLLKSLEYDRLSTRWLELVCHDRVTEIPQQIFANQMIREARLVIAWYSPFIHLKIARAISSRINTDWWAEETGLQKDSDGSAKIALIAMERSKEAWHLLYDEMAEWEDEILQALIAVQDLLTLTHEAFPNAMTFRRPGFDTVTDEETPGG